MKFLKKESKKEKSFEKEFMPKGWLKVCSLALSFSMVLSLVPCSEAMASTESNENTKEYITDDSYIVSESADGNTVKVVLDGEKYTLKTTKYKDGDNRVQLIDENDNIVQNANYSSDLDCVKLVETEYNNSGKIVSKETEKIEIDDVVKEDSKEINKLSTYNNTSNVDLLAGYNYIKNENPLMSDSKLTQKYSDNYRYVGSYKYDGYMGYLYRYRTVSNAGSAKKFTFSKGTAVSTILSIIVASVGGGLTAAVVLANIGLAGVGTTIDFAMSESVQLKNIHCIYKVRVGSKKKLSYKYCSKEQYWYFYTYNKKTDKTTSKYKFRKAIHTYNGTHYENIKFAIQSYEDGEYYNGACS